MTRVFIVAASPVVRAGLETVIAGDARFTVVGSVPSVRAAREEIEDKLPDVVLCELEQGETEALSALLGMEEPAGATNPPAIVTLVSNSQDALTAEWLRSGVRAILPRSASSEEIMAAVEAAATGLIVLHGDALEVVLPVDGTSPVVEQRLAAVDAPVEALTNREIEVLGMLAEGLGNKTIAWRLSISEHTVKFHVASIFAKLGVSSRTEAVTQGLRQGLIML